ncbi:MAG: bifunctional 4-hydroxy-2-oxoglutarate aldolase/2-dehydro-3-deoxy-phosphogluconate aldolase [Nitrospirae bacterium]|nr:bifunctional 4-hydroxy-2-oxoglutarate aldolase/2-dehydro-3-deoxy-phosphogluconate aldolase [Nitrospirota bacterium]
MNLDVPVIGILRGVDAAFFRGVMDVSFASGLQAIEITMNTEGALPMVSANISSVPYGKLLGMGTIRNLDEAKKAVDAGAMFLVTPNTDTKVIEYAKSNSVAIIAGALTPTEVYTAWSAGADMVKVFPCGAFGPRYISELLGPFDHIPLVAVGGVSLENIAEYFTAGVRAVAASTSLFGRKALMERNLDEIAQNVTNFIAHCPRERITPPGLPLT